MIPTKETILYHNTELELRIWETSKSSSTTEWHYHKEVEFLLVNQGSVDVHLTEGTRVLKAGELMIIGSNQPHSTFKVSESATSYIVLQFDMAAYIDSITAKFSDILLEISTPLNHANYIFMEYPSIRKEAYQVIREILNEIHQQFRGYEIVVSAHVRQLLNLIIRNDTRRALGDGMNADYNALAPAIQYMEHHYNRKLSVIEVCRQVHHSPSHFMRRFKRATGKTFTEYLQKMRIQRAEQLLLTEKISIENICPFGRLPKPFSLL